MWRAKKNNIKKLKKHDGSWCSEQEEMKGMAVQYSSSLFTKDENIDPSEVVNLYEPKISEDINSVYVSLTLLRKLVTPFFKLDPLKLLDQMACLADSFNGIGFC
jgi:hypothetical protein